MLGDGEGFQFVGFSASRSGNVARGAAVREVWHGFPEGRPVLGLVKKLNYVFGFSP
jgi:hypothetical protein